MNKLYTIICFLFVFNSLDAQIKANAGADLEICVNDTLVLTGSGLPSGDTGSYAWYRLSDNLKVSSSFTYKVKVTLVKAENYQLVLTHTKNGVTTDYFDTISVVVNALPSFQYSSIPPRCYNDGAIYLTQNKFVKAFSGDLTQSETDIRYFQKFKKPSWITGGPAGTNPFVYDFPKFILNSNVPGSGLRDTICYEYRDYKGCYNSQCKPIRINPNPIVELKNGTFCQKSGPVTLDDLIVKPFNRVGGISSFRCIGLPQNSTLNKDSLIYQTKTNPSYFKLDIGDISTGDHSGDYLIEFGFKDALTGCQTFDTATVTFIKLPKISFKPLPKLCINSPLFNLDTMAYDSLKSTFFPNAVWKCIEFDGSRDLTNPNVAVKILNSVVNRIYFKSSYAPGQYYLKVSDSSTGCAISDSMIFIVNGLPLVGIDLTDTVCSNEKSVLLNNVVPSGNVGVWYGNGVSGRYFDASVVSRLSRYERVKIRYEYTNPNTVCTGSDSQYIVVQTSLQVYVTKDVKKTNSTFRMYFNPVYNGYIDTGIHKLNWRFSDGSSATGWYPRYKETNDSGLFKVWMDVEDGHCSYLDSTEVMLDYRVINTSVQSLISSGFRFYPNPASEIVRLEFERDGIIRLEDCTGKLISEHNFGNGQFDLSIADLNKGIYIISYTDLQGNTYRFKLLKE